MKKIYFLAGLTFLLAFMVGCQKEEELDSFSVSYSEGSAWVEYSYTATIDQNGSLSVSEIRGITNVNRKAVYQLTDSEITLIKDQLNQVIETDVSDSYGFNNENAPTDMPVANLTYKTTYQSHSVWIYYPKENEIPGALNSFIHTVVKMIADKDKHN